MISTNPFMDFIKNVFGFVSIYTLQVWHGEASFVQSVVQHRESGCPFSNLPGLVCVLGEVLVQEERYDWCHLAICVLYRKCKGFFNARMFMYFHC